MNLIAALGACCFFDKKPAIRVEREENPAQPALFY
jgi:hypothetical protein